MGDVIRGDNSGSVKVFAEFFNSLFPFMAKSKESKDQDLVERMRQEVDRGPISFNPVTRGPMHQAAQNFKLPDDYGKKLRERARGRGQKATR